MKRLGFLSVFICITWYGMSQFVPQPLNYPGPGYWPFYISITDPDHVWIGTFHESGIPYSYSVKTTDGGDSWIFDSIPVPGMPVCVSTCGWDSNTCYHVFYDQEKGADPSVWKTIDGGSSWSNIITTQFTGSFINFYHAFSADTGIAVGDPRDGYFEIQLTYDGGITWTRVPSSNIPAMFTNEAGLNHSYSAVGNSIWFTTSKTRCFYSTDRGQNWQVSEVVPGVSFDLGVCFSSVQNGAIWNRSANTNQVVVSNDGGATWDTVAFPTGYIIMEMSRVPGFEEGFVITAYKTGMRVYFTPDLFNTLQVIQASILSNGAVEYFDEATGWLGGGESGTNEIYRYEGILTFINKAVSPTDKLTILPNPSFSETLIKLPATVNSKHIELRITEIGGKLTNKLCLTSSGWVKLDAAAYRNGIYVIEVYDGNDIVAREKWIVNH